MAAARGKMRKSAPKPPASKVSARQVMTAAAASPALDAGLADVSPASSRMPPVTVLRNRPRDVRDMNRGELESYAMECGLMRRALELTDDRLRQNIQAFLMHTRE